MSENKKSESTKFDFFSILKNLFFLALFLQIVPGMLAGLKDKLTDMAVTKTRVGCLPIRGEVNSADWYIRQIHAFAKDDDIKAVLVKIDSPGGLPAASQAVFQELLRLKKSKPVVAEIQNMACSGAYYCAIAANKIIAIPSALVGNIGVLMQLLNVRKLVEHYNVNVDYIKTGDYKTVGSKFLDLTADQRAYLQATSDDMYHQFVNDVAAQRSLSALEHTTWANGKAFTGTQALSLGLVDEVGTYYEVVQALQKLVKSDAEIKFVYPTPPSLMAKFTGEDDRPESEMRHSGSWATQLAAALLVQLGGITTIKPA